MRAATVLGMTIEAAIGLWLMGAIAAIAAAAYLAAQLSLVAKGAEVPAPRSDRHWYVSDGEATIKPGGLKKMYGDAATLTLWAFVANVGIIAVVTVILALVWRSQAPSAE